MGTTSLESVFLQLISLNWTDFCKEGLFALWRQYLQEFFFEFNLISEKAKSWFRIRRKWLYWLRKSHGERNCSAVLEVESGRLRGELYSRQKPLQRESPLHCHLVSALQFGNPGEPARECLMWFHGPGGFQQTMKPRGLLGGGGYLRTCRTVFCSVFQKSETGNRRSYR